MRLTAFATIAFTALVASGAAFKLYNEDLHVPLPFGVKNMLGIEHKAHATMGTDDAAVADDVSASTVAAKTISKGTKIKPTKLAAADEATKTDEVSADLKTKAGLSYYEKRKLAADKRWGARFAARDFFYTPGTGLTDYK